VGIHYHKTHFFESFFSLLPSPRILDYNPANREKFGKVALTSGSADNISGRLVHWAWTFLMSLVDQF